MKFARPNEVKSFDKPTALPNEAEASIWQAANQAWWENNPMRYDWHGQIPHTEFSKEFYQEIDNRFFSASREFMPWRQLPFEELIEYAQLPQQDVLEIGVGNGSHAQLLATYARSFTGIDLTSYSVESTSNRLQLAGLNANILQMDAEQLTFPDNSFDLVWSWGVIHHSSNTFKILEQINRVLRPRGKATIMVYYRSWWNYYMFYGFFMGVLKGELLRYKSIHEIVQNHNDGALARFYSVNEWKDLCSPLFDVERIRIYGDKNHLIPLPASRLKDSVKSLFPTWLTRFLGSSAQMGGFLVAEMRKL